MVASFAKNWIAHCATADWVANRQPGPLPTSAQPCTTEHQLLATPEQLWPAEMKLPALLPTVVMDGPTVAPTSPPTLPQFTPQLRWFQFAPAHAEPSIQVPAAPQPLPAVHEAVMGATE